MRSDHTGVYLAVYFITAGVLLPVPTALGVGGGMAGAVWAAGVLGWVFVPPLVGRWWLERVRPEWADAAGKWHTSACLVAAPLGFLVAVVGKWWRS